MIRGAAIRGILLLGTVEVAEGVVAQRRQIPAVHSGEGIRQPEPLRLGRVRKRLVVLVHQSVAGGVEPLQFFVLYSGCLDNFRMSCSGEMENSYEHQRMEPRPIT